MSYKSVKRIPIPIYIIIVFLGFYAIYCLIADMEVKTSKPTEQVSSESPTEEQFLSEIKSYKGSCSEKWSYAENYSLLIGSRQNTAIEVLAMASYGGEFVNESCSASFEIDVNLYCDDNLQELAKRHFGSYASRGAHSAFNRICQDKILKLITNNPEYNSVVNFYSLDSNHPWMKFRQSGFDYIVKTNEITSILSIPNMDGFSSILVNRKGINSRSLYLVFTQESAYVEALDNISNIYAKSSLAIERRVVSAD